ncbi:MAG: T9SS type A sorting domain-containing protein, partial [Chitinophagales bacterium]
ELVLQINKETPFVEEWQGNINIGGADVYTFNGQYLIYSPEVTDYICIEAINVNDDTETNTSNNKVCTIIDEGLLKISKPYPNPATNLISLDIIMKNAGQIEVELIEVSGKSVKGIENLDVIQGYNNIAINTDNVATGSYIIMIKYLGEEYTEQISIVNR